MPLVVRILFFVMILSFGVWGQVFIYRRLVRDLTDNRLVRRAALAFLAVALAAVPVGRLAFNVGDVPPWLSATLMAWWGISIYLLLVLLAFEVVRKLAPKVAALASAARSTANSPSAAPGQPGDGADMAHQERAARTGPNAATSGTDAAPAEPPTRRDFLTRAAAVSAFTITGGVSAVGISRAFEPPQITETVIKLAGLPKALEGFSIVQLSDLHIGAVIQAKFVDQLVAATMRAKPDLVAITGDLVDGSPDRLGQFAARLKNITSRHGTYFVSGNHDYYSNWEAWAPVLQGFGFTVLRNRAVVIGDAGASFDLVGVDDWGSRFMQHGYDLDAATQGLDPARASVLLAHQPVNLDAVSEKRLGLQLSGHTHAGQIFPGRAIAHAIYGDATEGLSRQGNTWQYTSRGCGFVGPPMRVDSPPEVAKLVLVSA